MNQWRELPKSFEKLSLLSSENHLRPFIGSVHSPPIARLSVLQSDRSVCGSSWAFCLFGCFLLTLPEGLRTEGVGLYKTK